MADRLTLEERRVVASLMKVYGSPTVVRQMFQDRFASDPPSRLTIRRIYQKFVETGSVTETIKEMQDVQGQEDVK
jgi:hypothetical protein